MEFGGFLSVIRRWWWTLLIATFLAGLAGYAVAGQMPAEYEARTRLLVGPLNTDVDTLRASGQLARTYAELVTSQSVLEATSARLQLGVTPTPLTEMIRPTADSATRLLIIRVRDADAERAAAIANELAAQLTELAAASSDRPDGLLTVIDAAVTGSNVATSSILLTLLAAIAGLSLTFVFILVSEYFSESLGSDADIARHSGVDVLCTVAAGRRLWGARAAGGIDPLALRDDGHRVLAATIEMSGNVRDGEVATRRLGGTAAHEIRTIVVLGTVGAERTGELAVGLAASLAEYGRRVVLVDADHTGAQVSALLGMSNQPGLADALADPRGAAVQAEHLSSKTLRSAHGFSVIPAGRRGLEVSLSPAMAPTLVSSLLKDADAVIISAAVADRSPTALVWAGHADATVLAVNRTRTRRQDLLSAMDSLRLVHASVLGIVVTQGGGLRRWPLLRDWLAPDDADAPTTPWPASPPKPVRARSSSQSSERSAL